MMSHTSCTTYLNEQSSKNNSEQQGGDIQNEVGYLNFVIELDPVPVQRVSERTVRANRVLKCVGNRLK